MSGAVGLISPRLPGQVKLMSLYHLYDLFHSCAVLLCEWSESSWGVLVFISRDVSFPYDDDGVSSCFLAQCHDVGSALPSTISPSPHSLCHSFYSLFFPAPYIREDEADRGAWEAYLMGRDEAWEMTQKCYKRSVHLMAAN